MITLRMAQGIKKAINKVGAKEYIMEGFLEPGLVSYQDVDGGVCRLDKETIDKMLPSFIGCPVTIDHVEESKEEILNGTDMAVKEKKRGSVTKAWWNAETGKYDCSFTVEGQDAAEAVLNGYSGSCAYNVTETGPGGELHAMKYNETILGGEFEHLALVTNPRYEDCRIKLNGKVRMNGKAKTVTLKNGPDTEFVMALARFIFDPSKNREPSVPEYIARNPSALKNLQAQAKDQAEHMKMMAERKAKQNATENSIPSNVEVLPIKSGSGFGWAIYKDGKEVKRSDHSWADQSSALSAGRQNAEFMFNSKENAMENAQETYEVVSDTGEVWGQELSQSQARIYARKLQEDGKGKFIVRKENAQESEEFKREFAKEQKEHPELPAEEIKKIVLDHAREKNRAMKGDRFYDSKENDAGLQKGDVVITADGTKGTIVGWNGMSGAYSKLIVKTSGGSEIEVSKSQLTKQNSGQLKAVGNKWTVVDAYGKTIYEGTRASCERWIEDMQNSITLKNAGSIQRGDSVTFFHPVDNKDKTGVVMDIDGADIYVKTVDGRTQITRSKDIKAVHNSSVTLKNQEWIDGASRNPNIPTAQDIINAERIRKESPDNYRDKIIAKFGATKASAIMVEMNSKVTLKSV